jgi:UDP-glucose 4-epimerase
MNCLVLGGAGFLGSHLCDALLCGGHSVRVFDRVNVARGNLAGILDRVEMIEGDFSDSSLHADLAAGSDIVYHLISTTVPRTSNGDPAFDVESNVVATVRFLAAARAATVKKIVFFSSGGTVYGVPRCWPISEGHPTDPICSYGIGKLAIEKYLKLFHHLHGLDYTVLRISNPYGARQRPTGVQGVVAAFADRMRRNAPLEIWGDGSTVRDYIHVSDVVRAALAAGRYGGVDRIFNIGSGRGLSLLEVAAAMGAAARVTPEIVFSKAGRQDVSANVLDITRARRRLCWQPMVSFDAGLRRLVADDSEA